MAKTDNSYKRLFGIQRDIIDSLSTTIKIDHGQIMEIVVADLLGKYKAAINRDDKWVEPFKAILLFYLEQEELDLLLSMGDK